MRTVFGTSVSLLHGGIQKARSLFDPAEGRNIPTDKVAKTRFSANLTDLERRIRHAERELASIRKQLKMALTARERRACGMLILENEILQLRKDLGARRRI
jgi:hypothetical protein